MTILTRIEEIVVEHTRLAKEVARYRYLASISQTEEEANSYLQKVEKAKEKIEHLRAERKILIGK